MYIWVILTTFLAMLASFSLSVRSDMRDLTVVPVAEAELGKMFIQHRAATNYARYKKIPFARTGDYVDFTPGIISDGDLEKELPYGYALSGDYISQIFCTNSDKSQALEDAGSGNPCDDVNNRRILITYGPIPTRWMSLSTSFQRPNSDYMNAMRNMASGGEIVGYMAPIDALEANEEEDNPSGSNVRIIDRSGNFNLFVPTAILNDPEFSSLCDINQDSVCMVYMSSI